MMRKAVLFLAGTFLAVACHAFPNAPLINVTNVIDVTTFTNAAGDGVTTNTAAIQAAIDQASAGAQVGSLAGGTVRIPGPGVYLTGSLTMKSKVNLLIDTNAVLRLLPYGSAGTGVLLTGSSLTDVEISGVGAIDGQGADWWVNAQGSSPYLISLTGCDRLLFQDFTISNAPAQNLVLKGTGTGDVLVQRVNIFAPSSHATQPSHNTDGIDLAGTNSVIQDCVISTGDDNIAIGSGSGVSYGITVTNCLFGAGHGMSIGSHIGGGVSNLTVVDCVFTNTDYGIRLKSDVSEGGIAQNLNYYNLSMTNLGYAAVLIYSYYDTSSGIGVSPATAAGETIAPVTNTTPVWQNITISNLTATVASGGQAGVLWGRTEMPISNITLTRITNTAPDTFALYNVRGLRIQDCQFNLSSGTTFTLYNAKFTVTNSGPGASAVSISGLSSTNSIALQNAPATLSDTNIVGASPITLNNSTITDMANLNLGSSSVVDFDLGTNALSGGANTSMLVVNGNLTFRGIINVTNGGGLAAGVYTLMSYTGTGNITPSLNIVPAGFNYNITNGSHNVNLVVSYNCVNPTATVSGTASICSNSSTTLSAALTGTQPWTVTWSDGYLQTGVTASPATRSVSPATNYTYTVTALSDATGCPQGTLSGSATITVNPRPTATVSGSATICSGSSAAIQAALTGAQPWTVTWSDGYVQSNVTNSPATRSVSPLVSSNYTVMSLSDSNGCSAGMLSGNALITLNAHPTATVSGGGTVCSGSSVNIQAALTGTQPWMVTWSDGAVLSGITSNVVLRSVSPSSATNYTVTALSDATGCSAGTLSGSANVTLCSTSFSITSAKYNTTNFVLTWDSVASQVYQVLSETSLATGPWLTNATVTATSVSTSWTNTGISGTAQQFYRVVNTQ